MILDLERNLVASIIYKLDNIKVYNITEDLFYSKNYKDLYNKAKKQLYEYNYKQYHPANEQEYDFLRTEIIKFRVSEQNIPSIIEHIKELYKKDKLLNILNDIIKSEMNLKSLVSKINAIPSMIDLNTNTKLLSTKDFNDDFKEIFDGKYETYSDIKTGFYYTDKKIYGLHRDCMTIFSAPTGLGKTAFALNLAKNVGKNKKVLYINLEMNRKKIIQRFICMLGEIEKESLEKISNENRNIINSVKEQFEKLNIFFTDGKPQTIDDIKLIIRNANKNKDIDLIIIDYIGRVKERENENQKEHLKFKEWIMQLNELRAEDKNYHLWILTQLNRQAESMMNSRDGIVYGREAIGGSYAMLSEPDLVFTWYFHNESGKYILHCDKNRDGETGWDMEFNFNKKYQNIYEIGVADLSQYKNKQGFKI